MTDAEKIAQLEAENATLKSTLVQKDAVIEQKNRDIIGSRKKYKSVSEMTEEEKQQLSEKELELQQRQEELEARQAEREKEWADRVAKDRQEKVSEIVRKYAGNDKELAEKIQANLSKLAGFDGVQTRDEIQQYVNDAFNMVGVPRPNAINRALNGDFMGDGIQQSSESQEGKPGEFADSERGKSLAGILNLGQNHQTTTMDKIVQPPVVE